MTFCWSTLRVKDLDGSIKFYREVLGLEVVRRFSAGPGTEIVFLGGGDTKIELVCTRPAADITTSEDVSWGFKVDSLDRAMALVKEKGLSIHSGPFQPNPGVRFFYLRDPNGYMIQIVEEL